MTSWRGSEGFEKGFITDAEGKSSWDDAPTDGARGRYVLLDFRAT